MGVYSNPFLIFWPLSDAEHQKVIVSLSKKKDRLSQTVLMYRDIFDTNKQLVSELECRHCIFLFNNWFIHSFNFAQDHVWLAYFFVFTGQVRDATHKLNELKPELMKCGLDISELATVSLCMHTNICTVLLLFAYYESMHLILVITDVRSSLCLCICPGIHNRENYKWQESNFDQDGESASAEMRHSWPFQRQPAGSGKGVCSVVVCISVCISWSLHKWSQQGDRSLGNTLSSDQCLKKSLILIKTPTLAC